MLVPIVATSLAVLSAVLAGRTVRAAAGDTAARPAGRRGSVLALVCLWLLIFGLSLA